MRHASSRAIGLVVLVSCTVYNTPKVSEVPRPTATDSVAVASPVKAHLLDGSTVVFRTGVLVVRDTIRNAGAAPAYRFNLTLADSAPVDALPLDSVVGMEAFRNSVNGPGTAALTALTLAGTTIGLGLAAIAIFGSCPTFYADTGKGPTLEAEGFSYSIAPLFETRDVDRLRAHADVTGEVRIEVRNEALETHYINQLGLLEVRHTADELVVPDAAGRPLALRRLVPPASARDRAGRDVRSVLLETDGHAFSTARGVVDRVTTADPDDFIDLVFARPAGVDSVALLFRMRNSLLNTLLLYELMLGDPGARSLDWMGQELENIGPAARLGRWYAGRMGMHVLVRDGTEWRDVGRIPDTGPIAWDDVAVPVPVFPGDSLRIRVRFVVDDWRVDRIQAALGMRRAAARALAPADVIGADGRQDTAARASLDSPDGRYLVTSPGQRFEVRFAAGAAPRDSERTFLLVSQGYYVEWLRASWMRGPHRPMTFEPSDAALIETLHRWRAERADYERRFSASRIPVR